MGLSALVEGGLCGQCAAAGQSGAGQCRLCAAAARGLCGAGGHLPAVSQSGTEQSFAVQCGAAAGQSGAWQCAAVGQCGAAAGHLPAVDQSGQCAAVGQCAAAVGAVGH